MGFWTKKSDWLPLSNAKAQVEFWIEDLRQAQTYLTYVESFQSRRLPGYRRIYSIALRDVTFSEDQLEKAKKKLDETVKREARP